MGDTILREGLHASRDKGGGKCRTAYQEQAQEGGEKKLERMSCRGTVGLGKENLTFTKDQLCTCITMSLRQRKKKRNTLTKDWRGRRRGKAEITVGGDRSAPVQKEKPGPITSRNRLNFGKTMIGMKIAKDVERKKKNRGAREKEGKRENGKARSKKWPESDKGRGVLSHVRKGGEIRELHVLSSGKKTCKVFFLNGGKGG